MDYEEFYSDVWYNIGLEEITQKQQMDFQDEFDEMVFGLWNLNRNSGLITPQLAARILVLHKTVKKLSK